MASAFGDLRSRVTDLATCPICLELFNSPKSLPCLHTFCLKCIEGHCRDNEPGDKAACPVCRQKFKVPDNGVQGLVSNFTISDLVEARKAASDEQHSLTNRENVDDEAAKLIQTQRGKCDKHNKDDVRLYCFDCKKNVCVVCFAEEHKRHNCKDVDTVAAECSKQIDADIHLVGKRVVEARNEICRLHQEKFKFLGDVEEVGEKIMERGEELKQIVDKHVSELMAEVRVLKTEKCKEIESHKENVERQLLTFETFTAHCMELKSICKPFDITRAANDLHIRATELLQNDVTLTDYCAPVVTFTPMSIRELYVNGQNLVGVVKSREMKVARVVHTLPVGESVWGVTSLDNKLYVLNCKAKDTVDVYNTTTTTTLYSLLRHLSVPVLEGLSDMTSCEHYRCLYISDHNSLCVHRVELNGNVTKWSVNYVPSFLSVTSQFTVIVTCSEDKRLLEFTTEGKQLREISLPSDIVHPFHAIQLPNGHFVVGHGNHNDPLSRVCIVDSNGHVTQSYGGPPGSATVGELRAPFHLAVDKDGFIFVSDVNNRRVLLLSPTLGYAREIVSRDQLKWKPQRLFLDVDRRRLYVAECKWEDGSCTAGRVVVVQL